MPTSFGHTRTGMLYESARQNRTRHVGFALAELLAVMVILGVLAALAFPRLADAADRAAVRAAVADLARAYAIGRESAIYRRAPVAVQIDTTFGAVWVRSGGEVLVHRDLRSGYTVHLAASRDSMAYDARGLGVGAANLSVIVRRGRAVDTLFVSRLGRIRF